VTLEWIREDNQHYDGSTCNRCCDTWWIHADNVACHVVSKREIAGDGDENVGARRAANTGKYDACRAEMTVVLDFVKD
jgi:hypothetical protein